MRKLETKYWIVDNSVENLRDCPQIQEAAMYLKENELIAFPTETVYGLGANALHAEAVTKIFEAKGRPSDNPLIVHIANTGMLSQLVSSMPQYVAKLIESFWPGPLTVVLPKTDHVPENVSGGLATVAVRMPDHPVALALMEAAGLPLAAPSANLSGKPSPTTAQHVRADLHGRIAGILDGGSTGIGVESTVIDCTADIPVILRPGGITRNELEEAVGKVLVDPALQESGQAPKSPGMKYKHYAPDAPFVLVAGNSEYLQQLVAHEKKSGKKVGILTTEENQHVYKADVVLACGRRDDLSTVMQRLYATLRTFNEYDVDIIFSEVFPQEGIGEALMNRLLKAANGQVIREI